MPRYRNQKRPLDVNASSIIVQFLKHRTTTYNWAIQFK